MNDRRDDFEQEETDTPDIEHNQTEFEKLYDQSLKSFKSGTVVRGRVLQIRSGVVMIDLGYKSDGIIPANILRKKRSRLLNPVMKLMSCLRQQKIRMETCCFPGKRRRNCKSGMRSTRHIKPGHPSRAGFFHRSRAA